MAAVENVEWLNMNLLRAYPLHEDSDASPTLLDGSRADGFSLPTCLVTDFSFTLPYDAVDGTLPSITGISHVNGGFSVEVALGDTTLTSVSANASEHAINQTYFIEGQGEYSDCRGWITLGDLDRADKEMPDGVFRFEPGQLQFVASTLRMAPRGVRSITAVGKYGLKTYPPLYGNVKIIAGSDMVVRPDSPDNALWLQAESSTGYERTEPCECGDAVGGVVVKTINGISVENVQIVGDGECVSVERVNDSNVIRISDACATPCCGCSELNFVASAIETITQSISTLQAYAEDLKSRMSELDVNVKTTKVSVAAYPAKHK